MWPGVHSRLVVYLADQLQPLIRPRYLAAVEERVYVEGPGREIIPDVWIGEQRQSNGIAVVAVAPADGPLVVDVLDLEIHESYIEILDRSNNQKVVTVIEVVSPANKYSGTGRDSYLQKQREGRHSDTHLVEIDLLRGGPSVLAVAEHRTRLRGMAHDYLACVNRAIKNRGRFELYFSKCATSCPRSTSPWPATIPTCRSKFKTPSSKSTRPAAIATASTIRNLAFLRSAPKIRFGRKNSSVTW